MWRLSAPEARPRDKMTVMIDQLWGIGGVVAGIAATSGFNRLNERAKLKREIASNRCEDNRKRCERLIQCLEEDIEALVDFRDRHDALPEELGYDTDLSRGREMLTEFQFHCPPKIFSGAVALVEAFESWEAGRTRTEDYELSRTAFMDLVRKHLT